jgi:uncharacterized protein (TIGR02118 family)
MTKLMFVVFKRPDMDPEQFRAYWTTTHAALGKRIPGLRRYVQNVTIPNMLPGAPPCDGVGELWFDSPAAMYTALGSPEAQATMADVPNFCDPRTAAFVADELTMI